jgi:hypothetical protein
VNTGLPADNFIEAIHLAFKTAIATRLTGAWAQTYVDIYPRLGRTIMVPAVLIDNESMDQPELCSNGDLHVPATFSFYCVVDRVNENGPWMVRELSARVMKALYKQYVIAGHGKIDVLGAVEDNTRPELDSYWVWRVDANCMLNIPEDAEAPVARPTEIYLSHVKEETNTVVSGPDLIIEG